MRILPIFWAPLLHISNRNLDLNIVISGTMLSLQISLAMNLLGSAIKMDCLLWLRSLWEHRKICEEDLAHFSLSEGLENENTNNASGNTNTNSNASHESRGDPKLKLTQVVSAEK